MHFSTRTAQVFKKIGSALTLCLGSKSAMFESRDIFAPSRLPHPGVMWTNLVRWDLAGLAGQETTLSNPKETLTQKNFDLSVYINNELNPVLFWFTIVLNREAIFDCLLYALWDGNWNRNQIQRSVSGELFTEQAVLFFIKALERKFSRLPNFYIIQINFFMFQFLK